MAGSTSVSHYTTGNVRRIVVDWTADAADASVPNTTLPRFEGRLMELHTNPGAVAPTDNYDVTITDAESIDRLQGVGANRDTANTEASPVVFSGSTIHPVVSRSDVLTLAIANNAVNSATGKVILIYGPA